MIIDLHGLTEEEATSKILFSIWEFEENDFEDELEIITGRGDVLTRVTEELLEEKGWSWKHYNNNLGSYIIKKY